MFEGSVITHIKIKLKKRIMGDYSKSYLNMLKDIPEDIQKDVIESIDIANKINSFIESKGLTYLDFAEKMNRSESEIRKWLTGFYKFNKDLSYKGYTGTVDFSIEDGCFFGQIAEIDSLVNYEGQSIDDLKNAFIEAVEDYIEITKTN